MELLDNSAITDSHESVLDHHGVFSTEQERNENETDHSHESELSEEIRADSRLPLKVTHIKVNGLLTKAKLQQIQLLLEMTKLDVLGISESKLTMEIRIFKYQDTNL